jgi:hypothetical protein
MRSAKLVSEFWSISTWSPHFAITKTSRSLAVCFDGDCHLDHREIQVMQNTRVTA